MADDNPLTPGPRRSTPPERLEVRRAGNGGAPASAAVQPPKIPYFLVLEQQRQAFLQNFDASRDNLRRELIRNIQQHRGSRVVVYYSVETLTPKHAELLQDILAMRPATSRLDLFLLSPGGFADAGHKMATLCRAQTVDRFGVLIPYYAKSAATLLCLGADELVMGPASELGPIDPRIRVPDQYGRVVNVSAVSLREALELLERRAEGKPENALLYAPLLEKVDLNLIGEYERALKSSRQIAETQLFRYMLRDDPAKAADVAEKLSSQYFSHGHAIERTEAREVLGLNVVEPNSELWDAMWQLHKHYAAVIEDSPVTNRIHAVFESEDIKFTETAGPGVVGGTDETRSVGP